MYYIYNGALFVFIFTGGLLLGAKAERDTLPKSSMVVQESCNPTDNKCYYKCKCEILETKTIANPLEEK